MQAMVKKIAKGEEVEGGKESKTSKEEVRKGEKDSRGWKARI